MSVNLASEIPAGLVDVGVLEKCHTLVNVLMYSYIDKCMALLQDSNIYQPCRDLTGQIHRQVQCTHTLTSVWHFSRTPTSTNPAGISLAKFTDKSRQRFANSRENMGKNTNGCSYNTINCSPQVTPVHLQDFTVYQKYIKQIAQCIL